MRPPDSPTVIEEAFRRAVLSDSLDEGRILLDQYVAHVASALRALAPGSEAARELEARARRLFEWAGIMALGARESASAELARLQLVACYHAAAGEFSRPGRQA